jgi:thioredoxin 1
MKRILPIVAAVAFLAGLYFLPAPCRAAATPEVPAKGMVTMVDLGANKCVVCKMMSSIVDSLQKEYQGKAEIVFIDVWKNPDAGQKFGVKVIPTQVFYDKSGKEVYRHEGLLLKGAIISKLQEMGVK